MNEIVKLAIDVYKGTLGNYSKDEANEVLRKSMLELAGMEDGKMDYKSFRRNKVAVFEILEEIFEEVVNEGLEGQFDGFVEYRNLKFGDTNKFIKPDNSLFKVAMIADGTGNLRRQRLKDGEEFSVSVATHGVKIYEEFHRFLAGRINWVDMVNRVAKSFNIMIANQIYSAVYNSFGKFSAPYHVTASYSEATLIDIASHVEAATGEKVVIYGTKKALSKVTPSHISDQMTHERNQEGFFGVVAGYELRVIPQNHKIGTDEFQVDENFLMILPQTPDRMVKIVNEGNAIIQEQPGGQTADMSMEYLFTLKYGMAVIPSAKYGILRLI